MVITESALIKVEAADCSCGNVDRGQPRARWWRVSDDSHIRGICGSCKGLN
jgi:hypothetical protein